MRNLGWGALSLYHLPVDVSEYGVLEFYIRGSEAGQQIWFYASGTGGSSEPVLLNDAAFLDGGTLSTSVWKRVQVRLGTLPNMPDDVVRLSFYNNSGSAAPGLYLDEMRLMDAFSLPPLLESVSALDLQHVGVSFDQAMDSAGFSAASFLLYSADDAAYDPAVSGTFESYSTNGFRAEVVFASPFVPGASYTLTVDGASNAAGIAMAEARSESFSLGTVSVAIDAGAGVHPISPYIYGLAYGDDADYLSGAGITVNRWGGNARSKYNWKNGATNIGLDWYFENVNAHTRAFGPAEAFACTNSAAGCCSLLTLPLLDWVAKDTSSYSFPVSKYGAQDSVDTWKPDAGNGVQGGTNLVADPTDAYVPARAFRRAGDPENCVYQDEWLRSLKAKFGPMVSDAITFVAMDNEMDIWSSTHRDVHPDPVTYDEVYGKFIEYASMVRSNWPNARITGPVSTGWWYFWNSQAGLDDKAAHGDQDFLPWFLVQVQVHDAQTGVRTLDVLDIHYYPTGVFNDSVDSETQARRLRTSRSFWDPTYQDEGWVGSNVDATQTQSNRFCVMLIPRMQQLIGDFYPGTKLGLTEWNMGGEGHISGALAVADSLGIFGREDLYLSTYWASPDADSCVYQVFKLYGNYDGNGSRFAPLSVSTVSSDQSELGAYAAVSTDGAEMTLICINKNPTTDLVGTLSISDFAPAATAAVYQITQSNPNEVTYVGTITNAGSSFDYVFPAYSATLLVFSGTSADADEDGLPDPWELAYGVSDAVGDADGDGISNLDELRAGTDPLDGDSRFSLRMHSAGGTNRLGVCSVEGRQYRLSSSGSLSGGWASREPVRGNSSLLIWDVLATNRTQFYRVEVLSD